MAGAGIGRAIGGLFALVGGGALIATWGLYVSLWSLIGALLMGVSMFGGILIFKEEYVRGGTMSLIAAIIAWGLYPTHPLSGLLLAAVALMALGGVFGLVLELTAD
jgi:hypothetical protein